MSEEGEIERILFQLDNEAENTPERIIAVTEELAKYLESLVEGSDFDMGAPLEGDG